jgi:hypothetical protein
MSAPHPIVRRKQFSKHGTEHTCNNTRTVGRDVFFLCRPWRIKCWVRSTSSVALRVVGGDEKGTQCLGDINTGTWPSRLWWVSNLRHLNMVMSPAGSDPRMTTLARTSRNFKWQTHPLVKEGATHQQINPKQLILKQISFINEWMTTTRKTLGS